TARSYQPLAAGTSISVQSANDTDQSERLKASIEASLRDRGYKVSDDSPLVLEFYGSEVLGNQVTEKPTGALALQNVTPETDRSNAGGLLDSINSSLFGGKGEGVSNQPDTQPPVRQVHLSMTLSDRKAARRVWQGTAAGDLRNADSFATTQSLVPILVGKIGMSANNERFDLQ
ncbi:MAG TPA: DUF4136 domain-containing protein, partial [Alphaproteobacteria bacterium]|nr:DUF4136 domain-containing protein [Alphaproteobacteria bacterium]